MRLGLTRQAATGRRNARHDRSHAPGRGNGGAASPAETAPVRSDEIELGPVEMSQPEPQPASRSLDDERRARAAGGPEDRAHYSCSCGYAFEANVSTSVACPHCGAGQAW